MDSDRFMSTSVGAFGGLTPSTDPPGDPFDPPSAWYPPPGKIKPKRGPRMLAIAATVVALIGMLGVFLLGSNTASAGSGTVLSATAPIAAVSQPASAFRALETINVTTAAI